MNFHVIEPNGNRLYFSELQLKQANMAAQRIANETGKTAIRYDSRGEIDGRISGPFSGFRLLQRTLSDKSKVIDFQLIED